MSRATRELAAGRREAIKNIIPYAGQPGLRVDFDPETGDYVLTALIGLVRRGALVGANGQPQRPIIVGVAELGRVSHFQVESAEKSEAMRAQAEPPPQEPPT